MSMCVCVCVQQCVTVTRSAILSLTLNRLSGVIRGESAEPAYLRDNNDNSLKAAQALTAPAHKIRDREGERKTEREREKQFHKFLFNLAEQKRKFMICGTFAR